MERLKQVVVNSDDYSQFKLGSSRSNKILRYWISILHSMPILLLKESRRKPTNLVFIKNIDLGYKSFGVYKFITQKASPKLANYLKDFSVLVEHSEESNHAVEDRSKENKYIFN